MASIMSQEDYAGSGEAGSFAPDKIQIAIFAIFIIGVLILASGVGLFFLKWQNSSSGDIQILSPGYDTGETVVAGPLIVHVDGAVIAPGVYKVTADARVEDAIRSAGGMNADADLTRINLASKLSDGQKVYVARIGEVLSGSLGTTSSQSTLISINNASSAELDKLPGIGPATAAKIIAARPYSSLEELVSKKAVSSSVYEKLKDLIAL